MTTQQSFRGWLAAGVGAGALAVACAASAAPATAPSAEDAARDARIARLEAAVEALQGEVAQNQQLRGENTELKSEVGQLQAEVTDLKATTITQLGDVRQTEAQAPRVSFPGGRPTFATADGNFTASLRGQLQLDTAAYLQTGAGPTPTDLRRDGPALGSSATNVDLAHARDLKDGTFWRRARIGIDGTAYGDFEYRLLFDFGGSGVEDAGQLYEGWAQYSGLKPFHFRIGAWAQPIGLEDQMSTNAQLFLERPGIADVARNLAAGDTRIGAGAFGYDNFWFVSADVTGRTIGAVNTGTFITSTTVGSSSADVGTPQTYGDQVGFVGRGVITPFHGSDWRVNVGLHGSYVDRPGDTAGPGTNGLILPSGFAVRLKDTPELRVDGTQFIDTGSIPAHSASTFGPEIALQKGPLFAEGEYETIHVDRSDGQASPNFSGWYLEGSWMLTGEQRLYNASTAAFDGPTVAHPFSLRDHGWGAWELAARYSDADLNFNAGQLGQAPAADAVRGGDQQVISLGLNWYLNQVFHMQFDVDEVHIARLSPSATNFQTPTGAQIGQTYTAIAVRTQAAF
ncbi:MAG TPA: porin [Caulobacteraceae bacterium]|jgi:phosphate-selective porin OprO/OprP|nr:porin [Caulobacteraceae bacterium]